MQLAPGAGEYTLQLAQNANLVAPTLAHVDPLTGLQGLQSFSAFQMQPAAPVAGTAVALPRPVQVPYTQVLQAADLNASLTNMSSLTPIQPTVSPATALPIANAAASNLNFFGAVPSSNLSVPDLNDGTTVVDSTVPVPQSNASTTAASWLVNCMNCIKCIFFSFFQSNQMM